VDVSSRDEFVDASEDASHRLDAALDISETLGLDAESLESAAWPQILDIAESAMTFGLLPEGGLASSTWQAVMSAPVRAATTLVSQAHLSPRSTGLLLHSVIGPCVRVARGASSERLRIIVLPGFSLLVCAIALSLSRAAVWPPPSAHLLMETLVDDRNNGFVRFWEMRDAWELRPAWHRGDGPVPLVRLLEQVRALSDTTVAE